MEEKNIPNDWKTLQRFKYSKNLIGLNHKDKNVPKGWKKSEMKILQIYGYEDKNIPNGWQYLEDKIITNDWKTLQRLNIPN